ncbi:MAG: aminodeoxychorismate/anthranilate synthase component II [Actinomycetota bacterium]|nr:aminodeoxychorismate/anthranilate synthase component II [Actinomycetota bacterium]
MKRVLLIDNYDSFTFNLAQALEELNAEVTTVRNDALDAGELSGLDPTHLVVSPGPGTPERSGISMEAVRLFAGMIPVLGVCLGHQAIGQSFGMRLVRSPRPVHGKVSRISHDDKTIYRGLDNPFPATRYHSLMLDGSLPDTLEVSACCEEGLVMGIRHRSLPLEGVQFHPESILTEGGKTLLENFLAMEVI